MRPFVRNEVELSFNEACYRALVGSQKVPCDEEFRHFDCVFRERLEGKYILGARFCSQPSLFILARLSMSLESLICVEPHCQYCRVHPSDFGVLDEARRSQREKGMGLQKV